jgi:molybdopterin-guanine dinucleotide biosynthesis protein A
MKDAVPTACIIAGGESRRFGSNKLLYNYKGVPLIEHVVNILRLVFNDIIIIAGDKKIFPFADIPVYPDIIPLGGPIAGVHSALFHSNTPKAFCFAGDLPNINIELIKYMISLSNDYDVVVPRIKKYYEPLYAIYSKKCIKLIESNIPEGKYQIFGIYDKCNVREVNETELANFSGSSGPEIIFKNINVIDDIE